MVHIHIMWDYDTAIGAVNATKPYNYNSKNTEAEYENVDVLLDYAKSQEFSMTFAVVGLAAEAGVKPYHVGEQIGRIAVSGHEIASHMWKHEWIPFLSSEQLRLSLRRSKTALEKCINGNGRVIGLVPPFNRPATWKRKCALSIGDLRFAPWLPSTDLEGVMKLAFEEGYSWVRVAYLPVLSRDRWFQKGAYIRTRSPFFHRGLLAMPMTYCGYDEAIRDYVRHAAHSGISQEMVISGHPAALSRPGLENSKEWDLFMNLILQLRDQGNAAIITPAMKLSDELKWK